MTFTKPSTLKLKDIKIDVHIKEALCEAKAQILSPDIFVTFIFYDKRQKFSLK